MIISLLNYTELFVRASSSMKHVFVVDVLQREKRLSPSNKRAKRVPTPNHESHGDKSATTATNTQNKHVIDLVDLCEDVKACKPMKHFVHLYYHRLSV